MNTYEHLSRILPTSGLKVLATMRPRKDDKGNPIYKKDGSLSLTTWHKTFGSIEELAKAIRLQANAGYPIYMAMGGYDREKSFVEKTNRNGEPYRGFSRSADFTQSFKAFWLDIDVGADKAEKKEGYADKETALAALEDFIAGIGLSDPLIVDSGRGVHAYWALTADIDPVSWLKMARVFDAMIKHYGLLADPACTADKARILRPIGTINHKNGSTVKLIKDAESIPFARFVSSLKPYYLEHKAEIEQIKQKAKPSTAPIAKGDYKFDDKPRSAKHYLQRCQVAKYTLLGKEPVAEPVWRGVISVMRLCDNGEKHLETLRRKCKDRFPDTTRFDEDRTIEKLNWFTSHQLGPFFCDTFRKECPNLCEGCPFANEVRTPLTLAEHYEEIPVPNYNLAIGEVETPTTDQSPKERQVERSESIAMPSGDRVAPQPPYPYKRTEKGLVVIENEREVLFFRGDLFPVMTRFVEVIDGEENVMVKYMLRIGLTGGYKELTIPMKEWYALDKLKMRLGSMGVSLSDNNMQNMIKYLRKYQEEVHEQMDEVRQIQHFGWADTSHQFLLGNKLYRPNEVITVQPHLNIKNYVRLFRQGGNIEGWKSLMQRLQDIGAVEQQICMLSSFGSTLMKFTNYNGIWFHLMTKPGYGKTTTQEMMNGVWGHPSELLLNAKDTVNAIEERFGRWANIGVTIDELSNLEPERTSDLLLGVTQGRTKRRLGTDMRERIDNLSWKLMVMSSGNFSLIDRINTRKEDVAAEISRTLEFKLPKPTLSVHEGERLIKQPVREHYGVAGPVWLANLTSIPEHHIQALIDSATEQFSTRLDAKSDERFWITGCAVIYVAGSLTNKMGLTNWDLTEIFNKLLEIVQSNRHNKTTFEFSATDALASFLSENTRNTVVTDVGVEPGSTMVKMVPSGALNVRYEQDAGVIYVRTQALKEYCGKRGIGLNSVKEVLDQRGLLLNHSVRLVMSKGLPNSTGRAYCIAIKVDELVRSTLNSIMGEANE